jgi:hypothetical protein
LLHTVVFFSSKTRNTYDPGIKKAPTLQRVGLGDPERGRTSDLQIRNLSLYPLSYGIIDWLLERLQIALEVLTPWYLSL